MFTGFAANGDFIPRSNTIEHFATPTVTPNPTMCINSETIDQLQKRLSSLSSELGKALTNKTNKELELKECKSKSKNTEKFGPSSTICIPKQTIDMLQQNISSTTQKLNKALTDTLVIQNEINKCKLPNVERFTDDEDGGY